MSKSKGRSAWPPSQPLVGINPPAIKLPVDALGDVLGPATEAIARIVQTSEATVAQSLLAAATLATQTLADVELHGRRYPIANYYITIASPGERKSAVKAIAFRSIRDHERSLRDNGAEELQAEVRGAPASIGALRESTILWEDISFDGIANSLAVGYASPGVVSDEGGTFLGGPAMHPDYLLRTISMLSTIHTNGTLPPSIRANGVRPGRDNVRLLLYLMFQPVVAEKLFGNLLLWEQGFLGRFLCVNAESLAGTRTYQSDNPEVEPSVKKFQKQIGKLLRMGLSLAGGAADELSPRELTLTKLAVQKWTKFHNQIEKRMAFDGDLAEIRGVASKASEQSLRLAAVLTLVSKPKAKKIQSAAIDQSGRLVRYYLRQALALYSGRNQNPMLHDAADLLGWLHRKKKTAVTLQQVYQRAPLKYRNATKARETMKTLIDYGWVRKDVNKGANCYEIRPGLIDNEGESTDSAHAAQTARAC